MRTPVVLVLVFLSVISTAFGAVSVDGGVTRCEDTGLYWYEKAIGETPCKTYERLRQICNSGFRVPDMRKDLNSDRCSDPAGGCCCNNIAFSLRMLCYTCQRGMGGFGYGQDVGPGAYQIYLTSENKTCPNETKGMLLPDVQAAVCNSGIKFFKGLYDKAVWEDGAFFFAWTRDELTKSYIAEEEGALSCQNTSNPLSSFTSLSAPTSPSTPDTQTGASEMVPKEVIAGICAALVGVILILWFLLFKLRRRTRRTRQGEMERTDDNRTNQIEPFMISDVPSDRNKDETPGSYANALVPTTPPPPYRKV
ncbi:hypothetical protein PQX77_015774 [Marasmius sp. AFHP31]|nr:hypothetical protein PQX77_015774 [Marasmius sp. AFHP31]